MLILSWLSKPGFLLVFIFLLAGCDLFSFGTKSKAVIQVENRSMTLSQFSMALAQRLKDLDPLSAKDPLILKTFKAGVTSDFIVDALIEQWFFDQKMSLSSKTLEEELRKTISEFPNDKDFREELAAQNKSYQDWRKSVEIGLKRKALFVKLRQDMKQPANAELVAHYQNNRQKYFQSESVFAESILLQDENQADVIKQLYRKSTFENLFKQYSLDKDVPGAIKYGWIERSSGSALDPLFSSKKTDLIGPIQVAEGYRIFKVIDRRPSRQRSYDEVAQQIKTEVVALRESARFSAWLDEQIKKYKIFRNTAAIDALVVETREE